MQYPLSQDEHAAMVRYLSGIRKQLQDVSDLFAARYGKSSNIAEIAVKTLVSATLLEHELVILDSSHGSAGIPEEHDAPEYEPKFPQNNPDAKMAEETQASSAFRSTY